MDFSSKIDEFSRGLNEKELLEKRNVKVAHCIGSNTKAGKGVMPLKDLCQHHITVGLGTDGPSSGNTLDIITQLPLVPKAHKTREHDRSIFPAKEVLKLAAENGAQDFNTRRVILTGNASEELLISSEEYKNIIKELIQESKKLKINFRTGDPTLIPIFPEVFGIDIKETE